MIGGVLGVVLSYYLVSTFKNIISSNLDIPYLDISIEQAMPVALTCMAIALVTGIVAAICSAYQISKNEIYRLIRECE